MTANKINQIAEAIKKNKWNYNYFGLRAMTLNPITGQAKKACVGEVLENSYAWEDGNPTDYELPGTCALGIDAWNGTEQDIKQALDLIKHYPAHQIVLIAGTSANQDAQDDREIIIHDAEVLIVL